MDPLFLNLPPNPRSIRRLGARTGGLLNPFLPGVGPGPLGYSPLSPPLLGTPPGFPPPSLLGPHISPGLHGLPLPGGLSMGMGTGPLPPYNPIVPGNLNAVGIPPGLLLALLAAGGGGGGALGLNGRRRPPPVLPPPPFMLDDLDDELYEDEEEMDPVAYYVRQLRRAKRRGMHGPGFGMGGLGGVGGVSMGGPGMMGGFGGMEFGLL
ncbi:hypothetical protein KC343_g15667 [Hortaea werneckii]|nr:hypothetical protein KC323_g8895 [Hortaea werneckii]KAI6856025.1 hypothetical protein KC338_g8618 [Hortaea werneckii]KAI7152042.1 hypothetical protein KC352_g28210 [Hortaea werneckii]KAI7354678.1 hypothetical protein KC320_g3318 [Hortaea werneckii]KAI7549700.1 hypothetical protein KC317_g14497 [Hortaea werneckii]